MKLIDKAIKETLSNSITKLDFDTIKLQRELNNLTIQDRKELSNRLKDKNIDPKKLEKVQKDRQQSREIKR